MVAPLLIGALIGAAQTAQQAEQEKQQKAIQSATARYSPWTGMKPDTAGIKAPTTVSNMGSSMLAAQDFANKNPDMFKSGPGAGTMEGAAPAAANQVPMASAAVPPPGSAGAVGATSPGAVGMPGGVNPYVAPWRQGMPPGGQMVSPWPYMGPMRPPGQ